MNTYQAEQAVFDHVFGNTQRISDESRTQWVSILTFLTMIAEITVGVWSGSVALLADGIHMGAHALALGLATLAYRFTRKYANDRRLSWGSGKINGLVAYTSSLFLLFTVVSIVYEACERLLHPTFLHYEEALIVAFVGLVINLLSVFILIKAPVDHSCGKHDHNFKAALIHVIADSLTSVGALVGILAAWVLGWNWVDPVVGLIASWFILKWVINLIKSSAAVLLDREADPALREKVLKALRTLSPEVIVLDLHVWAVGPDTWVVVAILNSKDPYTSEDYRAVLARIPGVNHPVVELKFNAVEPI